MKIHQGTTLIQNGQLIDGTGSAPVLDGSLLVHDGTIKNSGPSADCPHTPEYAVPIDALG